MKKVLYFLALLTTSISFEQSVYAQTVDTLSSAFTRFQWQYLKPGTEKFVLYSEKNGEVYNTPGMLWLRTVTMLPDSNRILISQFQCWGDTTRNAWSQSSVDGKSFKPYQFYQTNKITKMSTRFNDGSITFSLDSLKSGKSRSVKLDIGAFGYDFEVDEELFRILPLKAGFKIRIPFYQPNTKSKTKYYLYEVTGTEALTVNGGAEVACWKFSSPDYTGGTSTWWIAKKNHDIIKQERPVKGGGTSVKMRVD